MRILTIFMLTLMLGFPAQAQKQTVPVDMDSKMALAAKMHEIRPAADQINAAIEQVAMSIPAQDREAFKLAMQKVLNYEVLEKLSIESMARVYTLGELEAMVEYYSKPEAMSAMEKMDQYYELVEPKIIEMLDEAMMKVRMGETAP